MTCEKCGQVHDGQFGSGRFCSKKCARAFSTQEKRQQINRIVRQKLTKTICDQSTDYDFVLAVRSAVSWKNLSENLGLPVQGSVQRYLKRRVHHLHLETKHFRYDRKPEDWLTRRPGERKGHIKQWLLKIGRLYVCEKCNLGPTWCEQSLTLQVDHINGDNTDHTPENLRFLCPNCHSQTPTFTGRNVRRK